MIKIPALVRLSLSVISLSVLLFGTACQEITDNIVWPKTEIIYLYESPKIDQYKINSVALLPLIPDDTTDAGTFYSTNHFINSLEERHPKKRFTISKIDTAIAIDSLAIFRMIYSIESKRKLDLNRFYNSELGYDVKKDSADAIIVGIIDSCSKKKGYLIKDYRINKTRITSCNFTYYLISLKDGRVLWKANLLGEAGYLYYGSTDLYPPLDRAISLGIDLIIKKIPLD